MNATRIGMESGYRREMLADIDSLRTKLATESATNPVAMQRVIDRAEEFLTRYARYSNEDFDVRQSLCSALTIRGNWR